MPPYVPVVRGAEPAKEDCNAGNHVLCEKPFTINETEAQELMDADIRKGVFMMEGKLTFSQVFCGHWNTDTRLAVWTRFFPLFEALHEEIMVKKSIGEVKRFFIDFGNKMPLETLPPNSRLKDPALGAGALLDIGVYALTYASIILGDWKVGKQHPEVAKVVSSLDIVNGIDEANVVVLGYPSGTAAAKKTAICTSTFRYRGAEDFARIEGSKGSITILRSCCKLARRLPPR